MSLDPLAYTYIVNEKTYPKGSVLLEEGSKGTWVYVLLEGRAKVVKKTAKGTLTLNTLKAGDFFGEMGFLGRMQKPRSASVVAVEGPVRIGMLDPQLLERDYETIPKRIKELVIAMILKLNEADEKACVLAEASK
jgi:CRP-like cAMP-binding protein